MKITEFFENDFVNYASYDNLRKIASVVDGQKNASRKVLHTVLEKNIREKVKVSQLSSKVAEYAEYLHGTIDGVVVTLAQDFCGTNNIPLLQKKGNFGTRFTHGASASRYIYAFGTYDLFNLFKKEDLPILKGQTFEGRRIEPIYFVPTLPILLCNGADGVSSGFAQKILPRNPKDLKNYIVKSLKHRPNGKKPELAPFFNGFGGSISSGENKHQWHVKGSFNRISSRKITITEIPPHFDLKAYIKVLDKLEDDKVINSYVDLSDNDVFKFDVTFANKPFTDYEILKKLKLVKIITENFTVMSEENKIIVFESAQEVIEHYIEVKKKSIKARKESLLINLNYDSIIENSKYLFIKLIIDGKLDIRNQTKTNIESFLNNEKLVKKVGGSFDYLLNMSMLSLTKERLVKLKEGIEKIKGEVTNLENMSVEEIWLQDLKNT